MIIKRLRYRTSAPESRLLRYARLRSSQCLLTYHIIMQTTPSDILLIPQKMRNCQGKEGNLENIGSSIHFLRKEEIGIFRFLRGSDKFCMRRKEKAYLYTDERGCCR